EKKDPEGNSANGQSDEVRKQRKRPVQKGLPGLEGEILDRWYEYEATADGRILRFMVFCADQLKRSKEARTYQADALRKSRGVSDREFMNRYPDLFRRQDGSLPRRRPTILFYWRDKKHGCPYLPGRRILHNWREHGRIVNDPDDVDTIVK